MEKRIRRDLDSIPDEQCSTDIGSCIKLLIAKINNDIETLRGEVTMRRTRSTGIYHRKEIIFMDFISELTEVYKYYSKLLEGKKDNSAKGQE